MLMANTDSSFLQTWMAQFLLALSRTIFAEYHITDPFLPRDEISSYESAALRSGNVCHFTRGWNGQTSFPA
jgi:hypothetical protein